MIATSFARYDHIDIIHNKDAILESYIDLQTDQKWIDSVTKSTGDYQSLKYAFETWIRRLDEIMKSAKGLDQSRLFSLSFKQELFDQNSRCAICGNNIAVFQDAAVDPVEQYWLGGRTVPSNARLVHRACNAKRSKSDVAVAI